MPNPVFEAAMQAELATIEREAPVPVPPLGYGRDLSCVTDCTDDYAEVDPLTRHALAESLFRSVTTPRGTVIDAPALGIDVRAWGTGAAIGPNTLITYSDQARGEMRKDDRVDDVTCVASFDFRTLTLTLACEVIAVDALVGDFELVIAVTADGEALINSIV